MTDRRLSRRLAAVLFKPLSNCDRCGKLFLQLHSKRQRYCSPACSSAMDEINRKQRERYATDDGYRAYQINYQKKYNELYMKGNQ